MPVSSKPCFLFCLYHTASSRNAVRFHRNLRLSCLFALQDHDRSSAIQMAFGICDLVFRAWIAASHYQEGSYTVCLYLNLPFILRQTVSVCIFQSYPDISQILAVCHKAFFLPESVPVLLPLLVSPVYFC